AAAASPALRPELLLTQPAPVPQYDQISQLERTVFFNYTVTGHEDIWEICKRFHTDSFTVRSSNDLDLEGLTPGMTLRIPNHKGTLYEVRDPAPLQTISRGFSRGKQLK